MDKTDTNLPEVIIFEGEAQNNWGESAAFVMTSANG